MTRRHEKKPARVGEPVQVYLDRGARERLDRLTEQLAATKSAVLRRALETLERELLDPEQHPALRVIGLAAGARRSRTVPYDAAREHDRYLAETEPGLARESGRRTKRVGRRRAG